MRNSKRSLRTFGLIAALTGIAGPLYASAAEEPASPQTRQVASVRVDGVVYPQEQFEQRFGTQALHWVSDPEAEAQGVLVAYTTEEKRDAALGLDKPEGQRFSAPPSAAAARAFPIVYKDARRRGQLIVVKGNKVSLGSFNDKASSLQTFHYGLILYEHAGYRGCSIYFRPLTQVADLRLNRRCSINPLSNWNDRASSIKLIR
jgi:hypothetical protein